MTPEQIALLNSLRSSRDQGQVAPEMQARLGGGLFGAPAQAFQQAPPARYIPAPPATPVQHFAAAPPAQYRPAPPARELPQQQYAAAPEEDPYAQGQKRMDHYLEGLFGRSPDKFRQELEDK